MTPDGPPQDGYGPAPAPPPPWTARRPLLAAAGPCLAWLALAQVLFLLLRNRAFLGAEMAAGLGKLALLVALATVLLLLPPAALLRRLLPSWRRGDRFGATWAVLFGATSALVAAMTAAALTSSPAVPGALAPWIDALAALVLGLAAAGLRPGEAWLLRTAWVAAGLLLLALVPYPPWPATPGEPPQTAAAPGPARPDVVLVSIDTLRADHLGVYGRSPTLTPEMDRVAREGVVFTRGLAASPWTTPSVASLLTGLPTLAHGAGHPLRAGFTFNRSPLEARFTTLAERFAAAGYRTRAVVANAFLDRPSGLAQGFQEYRTPFSGAATAAFMRELPLLRLAVDAAPPERWGDYRAQGVTGAALGWLSEADERPLFLWVHYIDPHTPYEADPSRLDLAVMAEMTHQLHPPPREDGTVVGESFGSTELVRGGTLWLSPRDRERLRQHYAGEVAYTDRHVGRLFAALRARRDRRVVAALTADHGEEFWDHGHFEHGHDYYREVTWVPLVFWGAGLVPEGGTVASVAGLVDVAPTLLDLAGLPAATPQVPDEGRSLAARWAGGEEAPAPARVCGGNLYGLPAVLVEEGRWRFLLRANGAEELYDVEADPLERRNRAFDLPAVAQGFRRALEPRLAAFLQMAGGRGAAAPTAEQLEALRALGYVR